MGAGGRHVNVAGDALQLDAPPDPRSSHHEDRVLSAPTQPRARQLLAVDVVELRVQGEDDVTDKLTLKSDYLGILALENDAERSPSPLLHP